MWSTKLTFSNLRLSSIRNIFVFVLTTLAAALVWTTLTPQIIQAQEADDADVTWQGESLVYNGNTYTGPATESIVSSLDLPEDTAVYTYTEPASTTDRKIHIIYFAPGVDPGEAEITNYRTYDYDGPGLFSNRTERETLSVSPIAGDNVDTSSCKVEGGLGWFICPATNTLATFMDYLFDVLTGFLEVSPAQADEENALYRAWSIMRTFANVAFVIAFLIIIYSQITNYGVSNYGIKKLLPRIIIAAVLMNVSYIICSLAIDISNLLGYGLQGMFINIRNSLVGGEGNTWDVVSWESIASFVLAGGAAGVGAGIAAISAVTSAGGVGAAAVAILLPALVVVLFAVLVALLVLAARQAIITILVVISPLAFVAFLLPNTDKWFDKWRGLFMTMLLLFPAFSLIFGGSQLAGAVIIQNATSINVIILGLLVQAAPLYVTPMLIKLSGSLLGRIAGMVNNPNRGIIDRTRNFAKDRAENMKAKNLATPAKRWEIGKRTAQRYDHNRRRRESWRNVHNAQADANWARSADFAETDQVARRAAEEKSLGEAISAKMYTDSKLTNTTIQQLDVDVRKAKFDLSNAELDTEIKNWDDNHSAPVLASQLTQRNLKDIQSKLHKEHDSDYEEIRAGETPERLSHVPNIVSYSKIARDALTSTRVATDRASSAQTEQAGQYAELLQKDSFIAAEAGGIRGPQGYQSVLANAKKTASKFLLDDIQNIQETMDYDLATDVSALHTKFSNSTTMAERVAYAKATAKNGGPGIGELRKMLQEYESSRDTSLGDLLDFKELVGSDASIRSSGKDIEFWLNNSKDESTNRIKKFGEISGDIKTWTNLSANAFAAQNVSTHHYALELLNRQDHTAYLGVIDMIRNNPGALAQVKQGVRERFSIYSDREIADARQRGVNLPDPGTVTR